MEDLEFEAIDKEIEANEAAQVSQAAAVAKMTTKFNQEFYAQIKANKNEPFSSIN